MPYKVRSLKRDHIVALVLVLITIARTLAVVMSSAPISPMGTASIVINEIMFDPYGNDTGREWIELYNKGTSPQNISGWVISNRTGTVAATLPDWDFPNGTYLTVYFGNGTNDNDFSDGSGSFYTGISAEIFNNTEDEVALYNGSPSASSIIDFVSWSSDGTYNPGQAHDYAVSAGIWDCGNYFDIGFPTGKSVLSGDSIGRDKSSTDTNQPNDWDITGGVDAYYPTPGAKNAGPLYSINDGIRLTQLKANLFLIQWEYQITYANHTILEEFQTDNETYVKAMHYFEATLGEIKENFTGIGEYRWYSVNSSAWKEKTSFLLMDSIADDNFSMSFTKEFVDGNLVDILYENLTGSYNYEVFDSSEVYADNWSVPSPPTHVNQEICNSIACTIINQTESHRYHTEITQQVNDRGLVWNVSCAKDELILSDNIVESWVNLTQVNDLEGTHSTFTHYISSFGEELSDEGIGDLNVSYQDYTVTLGNKTFVLEGQGYNRINRVSNNYFNVTSNVRVRNVVNASEILDLGSSGYIEVFVSGEEVVVNGCISGNGSPKIYQFYIDGVAGAVAGGAACALLGAKLGAPTGFWVIVAILAGGAICGVAGLVVEPDTTKPDIEWEVDGQDSCQNGGWLKIKITVSDDSGLSNVDISIVNIDGVKLADRSSGAITAEKLTWEWTLRNLVPCTPRPQTVTVTATDASAAKNSRTDSRQYIVPGAHHPPKGNFSYAPSAPKVGLPVTFDASTSSDPDGTLVSYKWDFGDGTSGTGKSATHIYTKAGTYIVTLTVTDNDGLTATETKPIAVGPVGPVGGISIPTDKTALLAPYIGLASTILAATVASAIYVKRVKRRKEKQ